MVMLSMKRMFLGPSIIHHRLLITTLCGKGDLKTLEAAEKRTRSTTKLSYPKALLEQTLSIEADRSSSSIKFGVRETIDGT